MEHIILSRRSPSESAFKHLNQDIEDRKSIGVCAMETQIVRYKKAFDWSWDKIAKLTGVRQQWRFLVSASGTSKIKDKSSRIVIIFIMRVHSVRREGGGQGWCTLFL